MIVLQPLISEFTVIGSLKDLFTDSKGRVKYLYLSTSEKEYAIAVAKQQSELSKHLQLGCNLKVTGMRKNQLHRDEVEYKAYRIELLEQPANIATDTVVKSDRQKKVLILVCQGKSCCQRGGMTISTRLEKEIYEVGLADRVEIKATGCMKQCKQAPNMIMPGRKRYSRIKPEEISTIIDRDLQQKRL